MSQVPNGAGGYRPLRARLLLQVEDREAVEVMAFEPEEGISAKDGGRFFFVPPDVRESIVLATALTVELRAHLSTDNPDGPNYEGPEPDTYAPSRAELDERERARSREAGRP